MTNTERRVVGRRKGQAGIALLEALLALVIAVAGLLALIGFNARVASLNVNNRLSSAALIAAQAKLEELRNSDYDLVRVANGSDTVVFQSPGFATQLPLGINRCWVSVDVPVAGWTGLPILSQVTVAAVRQATTCSTAAGAGAAARLVTLIAKNNPRIAGQNSIASPAADGAGKVVRFDPTGKTKSGTTPSGFQTYTNNATGAISVVNADTGQALEASDTSGTLKFAVISGNLMFDRDLTWLEFDRLQIQAEGNGLCRKFYPGYDKTDSTKLPPKISVGGNVVLTFVQYSCVVPDGWRRAIVVLPPGVDVVGQSGTTRTDDKVCVGYPAMQGTNTTDVLLSPGRQYVGRKAPDAGSPLSYALSGMRGTVDGVDAQIGSVCAPNSNPSAGDCWYDSSSLGARGWVPGGHHYFVMSGGTNKYCATRMTEVMEAIDTTNAGRGVSGGVQSNYDGYLVRNPHKVYCTNTKEYTNTLPPIPLDGEFSSDNCYSYTKLSGFITPLASESVDPSQIVFGSSSAYAVPCAPMGAFWGKGGGYACGYPENVTNVRVSPVIDGYTLSPYGYTSVTPTPAGWGAMNQVLAYMHDIVGKSFTIGPAGSVCAAAATQTWTVGGNTCSAPLLQTASGQSSTVSNTASGFTGSATFACTGTTWGSATAATCAPVPSGCPAVAAQTWTVGTATCSAALAATASGGSTTVSNNATGFTGSATFACTGTTWGAATSASCASAPVTCPAGPKAWGNCSGAFPATAAGQSSTAANTVAGYSGTATFACTAAGTWNAAATSSSCTANPPCTTTPKSWTVNGNTCSATVPQTPDAQSSTVTNTAAGVTGSATFACSGSTFGSATSASCLSVCTTLTVGGNRKKNTPVTLDGTACSEPTTTTYACTKPNVAEGTVVAVRQMGSGANDKTTNVTVQKGQCNVGISFT